MSGKAPCLRVAVLLALLGFSVAAAQEETPSDEARPVDAPLVSPTESSESLAPPADSDPTEEKEVSALTDRPYWRQNLFGRFFRDQRFLLTTWWPSELRREGFTLPILAGVSLASTSSQGHREGTDLDVQTYVQNENRERGGGLARGFSFLGDAVPGAALVGTGYLIGRWSHNDRLAEASSLSAEALLTAGLWSSALKTVTARTRPAGDTRGKFFNYHPRSGDTVGSFPSGHATCAFTVATVFAQVYRDHKWVSWIAYGTAGLIGASRVALGRHFPSDVIVGALLGNSVGRMVLEHEHESGPVTSTLRPFFDPAGEGAGLVWTHDW
jgi:membrane-associated phospholipid phosphatase